MPWQWLAQVVWVQLFLTLISLPFLLWWGLPLSLLTLVGNIIFSPVIMVFLFLSTLLFFALLLGLPVGLLIALLEWVSGWWLWMLSFGGPGVLVAIPCPRWWILPLMPLSACVVLFHRHVATPCRRIVAYGALLGFFVMLCYATHKSGSIELPYGKKKVWYLYDEGARKHLLVDRDGVLKNSKGLLAWADYTVRSRLVRAGTVSVDVLVIVKPTERRLRAAYQVATRLSIPSILIPKSDTFTMPEPPQGVSVEQASLVDIECRMDTLGLYGKKIENRPTG